MILILNHKSALASVNIYVEDLRKKNFCSKTFFSIWCYIYRNFHNIAFYNLKR